MRNPFKVWWHWAGPSSPIGPNSSILIFAPSLVLAVAIAAPPLVWLAMNMFHPIAAAIGAWWAFWLS